MGKKIKKICWVTPDYFVDCDFNPKVLKGLLNEYEINWLIILPIHDARFSENDFLELQRLKGLEIHFIYYAFRQRDPRRLYSHFLLYKKIASIKYDLLYFNFVPSDPYIIPLFWILNKNNTIFCAHDGDVNKSFKASFITKLTFNTTYSFVKYVNMFSPSQEKLFKLNYSRAKTFTILLGLKSFGQPTLTKFSDKIRFLSFGIINYAKNIDLLIEAGCNIYERGYKNFRISINGSCTNWLFYESKIKYPEIFICDIRKIENVEIPNLFSQSHYLVQPYRMISQSGPLKIAFNYNLPVIVSDLSGFRDEVIEGVNGHFFKSGNLKSLEDVLIKAIEIHEKQYSRLLEKMHQYTLLHYSTNTLIAQYSKMFEEVIKS